MNKKRRQQFISQQEKIQELKNNELNERVFEVVKKSKIKSKFAIFGRKRKRVINDFS